MLSSVKSNEIFVRTQVDDGTLAGRRLIVYLVVMTYPTSWNVA